MTVIEAMARAMCKQACVDPDALTFPGVTYIVDVAGENYSYMPTGFQHKEIAPAWTRYREQAKAAYEAFRMATINAAEE